MPSWRTRESQKQSRCRELNESAAAAAGSGHVFRCECGDGLCSRLIALTASEYALVRADATHFAIALDHENPESEQVIAQNERFAVVTTVGGAETKLARRSDPVQMRRERRWA